MIYNINLYFNIIIKSLYRKKNIFIIYIKTDNEFRIRFF